MITPTLLLLLATAMPPTIEVAISMDHPERHFFQVSLDVRGGEGPIVFGMPVWTPGSYKVRDFSRNVERVRAIGEDGRELSLSKRGKSHWIIDRNGNEKVSFAYDVFARESSVRTSFLDAQHAHLSPSSVIMYVEGALEQPIRLTIDPPDDWHIDTALPSTSTTTFQAQNYDELVDSPLLLGTHRRHDFQVLGKSHRAVFSGESNLREPEMTREITKIVEVCAAMFGDLPYDYDRYLFMTRLGSGGGGLEHRNSTSMMARSWGFDSEKTWKRFLGLVAHEYFHLWNVKRIRDGVLGPFDYTRENYTRLLWMHEGWTEYYGNVVLLRAKIITPKEQREKYESWIRSYLARPGRKVQSLEASSYDSWIKFYQTNETSRNSTVDYYGHGALTGLCLDLIIRGHSENKRSLDDVMRRMNDDFARHERGFKTEDLVAVMAEYGGAGTTSFFEKHVRGTEEIDFEPILANAGLRIAGDSTTRDPANSAPTDGTSTDTRDSTTKKTAAADTTKKPWKRELKVDVGFRTRTDGGRLFVDRVQRDSNAWRAGLAIGDELIGIDDRRASTSDWAKRLAFHAPGDVVQVLIARGSELTRFDLELDAIPKKIKIEKADNPSKTAMAIYRDLIGEDFGASDSKKTAEAKAADGKKKEG